VCGGEPFFFGSAWHRGSPTRVGMDPTDALRRLKDRGFSRTRGDGPLMGMHRPSVTEVLPHARGWTGVHDGPEICRAGSPARVGMVFHGRAISLPGHGERSTDKYVPRSGEKVSGRRIFYLTLGFALDTLNSAHGS